MNAPYCRDKKPSLYEYCTLCNFQIFPKGLLLTYTALIQNNCTQLHQSSKKRQHFFTNKNLARLIIYRNNIRSGQCKRETMGCANE